MKTENTFYVFLSYENRVSMAFWQINTHCWDPWSEKSRPYFYFILFSLLSSSQTHLTQRLFWISCFLLLSFSFFLSYSQTRSNGHFFSSSFFFLSFLLHRNTWVTLSKKKRIIGTDFSNPENQTHKHMIPIIHTNKQTQIHKHVHPHNKSKNFFSKHRQNPEVRMKERKGAEKRG